MLGYQAENHLSDFWLKKIIMFMQYRQIDALSWHLNYYKPENMNEVVYNDLFKIYYDFEKNIKYISSKMFIQTIGHDKVNQLRHVLFLKDKAGVKAHMAKHRKIIKPKFDAVVNGLEKNLGGTNLARWTKPNGGYFVSLFVPENCAKKTIELAASLGVALTAAGSAYPYKKDPYDSNIRIAPTVPSLSDLTLAIDALCVCVKLAYVEKLIKG